MHQTQARIADVAVAMMRSEIAAGHKRILLTPSQAAALVTLYEDYKSMINDD